MSMWLTTTSLMRPTVPEWLEALCQRLTDNDPELTTLEISHQRINDQLARILSRALEENHTVTVFVLSLYNIVDDGAHAIGDMMRNHKSIRKVQFRDVRNSRELITLFRSIQANAMIEEFSLRHCTICRQGAEAMRDLLEDPSSAIRELRLVDSQIGRGGITPISAGLCQNNQLLRLYMINNELGTTGAFAIGCMLRKNKHIQEIYLCENELADEGIYSICQGLRDNQSVTLIDLRSNSIGPEGAVAIQTLLNTNKYIKNLLLGSNNLGDTGVSSISSGLKNNKVLQTIDLSDNGILIKGTEALGSMLATNTCLQELNLGFNAIGNVGAFTLACVLVKNNVLKRLSVRRNRIGNAGASAFGQKLPTMRGLKELIMTKNDIDQEGAISLCKGLELNMELEYLQIDESLSQPILREICHWITLNRAGRRIFRETNLDMGLWPRVLGKVSRKSEPPDVLFHFLREKPELIPHSRRKRKQHPSDNS